jgi:hypothetical protein
MLVTSKGIHMHNYMYGDCVDVSYAIFVKKDE